MSDDTRDSAVLNYIRAAFGRNADGTTDSELLGRFVSNNDQAAFELLVWRYSATVLRACRAILRDHHAAEDATQATFLAFSRKARSIKQRESVIGWLYCTARRISIRSIRRRPTSIVTVSDLTGIPAVGGPQDSDATSTILQELAYLHEKYRLPILLCFFEGLTYAEAARRLEWPLATVGKRLTTAKKLLHRRLTRRGIVVPAAGVAAVITINPVGAVSSGFISRTTQAAVAFAAERAGIPGVSETVVRMVHEELRGLLVRNSLWNAGIVALATLIGGTAYFTGIGSREPAKSIEMTSESHAIATIESLVAPSPRRKLEPDPSTIKSYKALGARYGTLAIPRDREDLEMLKTDRDSGRPCFDWRSVPSKGLPRLPSVDVPFGIIVKNSKLHDADLAQIAKLKNLTDLYLNFTGITDDGLKAISESTDLKTLNLSGNRLTDVGVEKLSALRNLERLDLSYTSVGDSGTHAIARLEGLRALCLNHTNLSDEGLKEIALMTGLEQLHIMQTDITDMGLKHLGTLKNLRALHLGRTSITDEGLRQLAPLRDLTYIDLCGTNVTDQGMAVLAESHPNLETINLYQTHVTDQGLRNLAPLTKLNGICLSDCPITGVGLLELARHRDLNLLGLNRTLVKDRDLILLNSLEKLQTLCLEKVDVGDSGLETLTNLKQLRAINLAGTKATGAAIRESRFPKISLIDMTNAPVTSEGLRAFDNLDSLTSLRLYHCRTVTDDGIQKLVGAKSLQLLEVQETGVTRAAARRLNQSRGKGKAISIHGDAWIEE